MAPAAPPGKPRCMVSEGDDIISGPDRWQGSGVSPAGGGEKFWALIFGPELAMLVHVRRSCLLLTAIGSQTGFAVSIVMSSTLLVMATAAAFGILRSGEV
jgi:hypothetical protein